MFCLCYFLILRMCSDANVECQHLYRLAVLVGMNCQTLVTTGGMIYLHM
jgi:hypothetical protein